ncbi:MAG: hypothetical protein WC043_07600 [Pseudobdellovibrionaceae bacterium]
MHPELAKILSDWEMDHDLALLLEKNKELHHFFANADVASISASLTPDNRKMLQDIMEKMGSHVTALKKEADDVQSKISSSRKSMEACLSYGSAARITRKEK